MTVDVPRFLERVYSAADEHRAADEIYQFMDDLLLAGWFDICNAVLRAADPKRLAASSIISFLVVTKRATAKLPARALFVVRSSSVLAGRRQLLTPYV